MASIAGLRSSVFGYWLLVLGFDFPLINNVMTRWIFRNCRL